MVPKAAFDLITSGAKGANGQKEMCTDHAVFALSITSMCGLPRLDPLLDLLEKVLASCTVTTLAQIAMTKRRAMRDKDVDARWDGFPLLPAIVPFAPRLDCCARGAIERTHTTCMPLRAAG